MSAAKHKKTDSKGRLLLGEEYANQDVIIEPQKDGSLLLKPAVVVQIAEAWLYKNKAAFLSVQRGQKQASQRQFAKDPRSNKDIKLVKDVEE
jgi:hypothetical protein